MPLVEDFPHIDPNVRHIGVSKLRGLNADKLRETDETFVIQENDQPLAVLLTYEKFLAIQEKLSSVANMLDMLRDKGEAMSLMAGIEDLRQNRVETLGAADEAEKKNRG